MMAKRDRGSFVPRFGSAMPPCRLLFLATAALLAGAGFSRAHARPPEPSSARVRIGRFLTLGEAGAGRDPLDRRRTVLANRYGENAPFGFECGGGPAFLLPAKAGRPIAGDPPRERPAYPDLFQAGSHAAVGFHLRMRPALHLVLRAGFEYYRGRTRTEAVLGRVSYDSMWILPVQAGLRFGLPLSLPARAWWVPGFAPRRRGAFPFVEAVAGVAHRTRVDAGDLGPYWRTANVFAAELSLGAAWRFGTLAMHLCAAFAYRSEPPERVWFAEPEAAMAVLVRAGFAIRF
jgi:hypothetical protein